MCDIEKEYRKLEASLSQNDQIKYKNVPKIEVTKHIDSNDTDLPYQIWQSTSTATFYLNDKIYKNYDIHTKRKNYTHGGYQRTRPDLPKIAIYCHSTAKRPTTSWAS